MNILILGASGMLGHKLFQTLRERFPDTHGTLRGALAQAPYAAVELFQQGNIIERVDAAQVTALLCKCQPRMVINCIGIVKQRAAAHAAIPSLEINALLPHRLAEACAAWGGRLIHISTDCVFNGARGHYREADAPDANDLYGQTKALGEVTADNALTLRTSIIGRELAHFQSLLEWFLAQARARVAGYRRAFYSGVTTNHLAQLIGDLLETQPQLSGLYQVASATISKYDLLCLLREAYRVDCDIVPDDEFFCDRSLDGGKFRAATGYVCPSWPELVAQLTHDATPYERWRSAATNQSITHSRAAIPLRLTGERRQAKQKQLTRLRGEDDATI